MNHGDSRCDRGAALWARLKEEDSAIYRCLLWAWHGLGTGGWGHACSTPVTSQHLAVLAEKINRTQSMPTPHLQGAPRHRWVWSLHLPWGTLAGC